MHAASAAPIPPPIARQPLHTFNGTQFPYEVTGPAPPMIYKAGTVLDRCARPKSYAISFDDGPGQLTDELLEYLEEHGLKVTFFVNGDNWSYPESQRLLKRAYESQHQIAAHPWSHRDLGSLSDDGIREEMHRVEQAFRQILGVVPRYMRPPYGEHGERVRRVLEEMGYVIILWDVDRLDEKVEDFDYTSTSSTSDEKPMSGSRTSPYHRHRQQQHSHLSEQQDPLATSKWAEAVRGLPSTPLDRDTIILQGIYQEATPEWAIEHVQSLGFDVMTVGQCLGEDDPRLWYKEIGPPANTELVPKACH
ncbi:hypothetical protein BGZ99_001624 [Dissophora globulifera]|uniref:NodB homology domain-containing protein n=1 Tax=Dissophora globulifera TaxID=979702 RepID=A0A9P6RNN4_9FUNG|nr:hypothetical protein BGZ99_001624 [Dissophora globulifera]